MAIKIQRLSRTVDVSVGKTALAAAHRFSVGPEAVTDYMPDHVVHRTDEVWSVSVDGIDAGVVYQRPGRRWYAAKKTNAGLVELPVNLGTRDFAVAALRNSINRK